MRHLHWQFYPSFGLKHYKLYDDDFNVWDHVLILGCFQFSWYAMK